MGVPKRRTSRSRQGFRRGSAAHKRPVRGVGKCPQCGGIKQPHRVCPGCGYYRGRPVMMPSAEE